MRTSFAKLRLSTLIACTYKSNYWLNLGFQVASKFILCQMNIFCHQLTQNTTYCQIYEDLKKYSEIQNQQSVSTQEKMKRFVTKKIKVFDHYYFQIIIQ